MARSAFPKYVPMSNKLLNKRYRSYNRHKRCYLSLLTIKSGVLCTTRPSNFECYRRMKVRGTIRSNFTSFYNHSVLLLTKTTRIDMYLELHLIDRGLWVGMKLNVSFVRRLILIISSAGDDSVAWFTFDSDKCLSIIYRPESLHWPVEIL